MDDYHFNTSQNWGGGEGLGFRFPKKTQFGCAHKCGVHFCG